MDPHAAKTALMTEVTNRTTRRRTSGGRENLFLLLAIVIVGLSMGSVVVAISSP